MTDRPKTPHDPPSNDGKTAAAVAHNREAKEWTRNLAEAGKLSGWPAKKIPHYGLVNEKDKPQ
jgi:hypothetical protein